MKASIISRRFCPSSVAVKRSGCWNCYHGMYVVVNSQVLIRMYRAHRDMYNSEETLEQWRVNVLDFFFWGGGGVVGGRGEAAVLCINQSSKSQIGVPLKKIALKEITVGVVAWRGYPIEAAWKAPKFIKLTNITLYSDCRLVRANKQTYLQAWNCLSCFAYFGEMYAHDHPFSMSRQSER